MLVELIDDMLRWDSRVFGGFEGRKVIRVPVRSGFKALRLKSVMRSQHYLGFGSPVPSYRRWWAFGEHHRPAAAGLC